MGTCNSNFVYQVLMEVLSKTEVSCLLDMGVPREHVEWLRDLSLQDLKLIANPKYRVFEFSATVLPEQIALVQNQIQERKNEEELIKEYLLNGASFPMMNALFGTSGHEFSALCRLLNITNRGRPPVPKIDTQDRAWNLWRQYKGMDERARFLKTAQELDLTLASLWCLISKQEEEEATIQAAKSKSMAASPLVYCGGV